MQIIEGYSKLSKEQKLAWLAEQIGDAELTEDFKSYWHRDTHTQKLYDEFSENTVTNFYMPLGIAPNFLINGKIYAVPMVIEESSVVAAAAKSAKYWLDKGGFRSEVISTVKIGQVHFLWEGDFNKMYCIFDELKEACLAETASITANMSKRGGGILDIELLDCRHLEPNYYQLKATFETCDSMGANFINSCLETFAKTLKKWASEQEIFSDKEKDVNVIMSILSNYTPQCIVRTSVECPVEKLTGIEDFSPEDFAFRFSKGVEIAKKDSYRATTHNKGIFNGIDAVILATGNDFRAVEACGHTYASRTGTYRSLSDCSVENGIFKFWIDLPLAVGTVGGLTNLHPQVKRCLQILGNPDAKELMMIISAVGLAQNFGAVKSLVTSGIQKGHMKMHLLNILRSFEANEKEVRQVVEYFKTRVVSFSAVREVLDKIRVGEDVQ
jgi:hydroxymethylglutaryl-CoA reductase